MNNLFSKVLWICLVWVAYVSAEIWEATTENGLRYHYWFDTTARTISCDYKGEYIYDEEGRSRYAVFSDLQMPQVTTGPWSFEYGLLSLDSGLESISMPPGSVFKSSNAVYFIKNKDLLDFSQPLPLQSDNYQLNYSATKSDVYDYVYLLGFGLLITDYGFEDGNEEYHEFHKEENFLFQTHSGYYALCHASLSKSDKGASLSGMVLTCAVQTDGSTRFDSLPSHPAPLSVRSRPVSRPSVLKNHRYTVDGSRLNDDRRRVWRSLGE